VTGTDTNVGKTVVSAALIHRYRNLPLKYWKPVQTGIEQDDDSAEVQRLTDCDPKRILNEGVRLPRPVSPHMAAKLSGVTVDLDSLTRLGAAMSGSGWVVEGAGGVLTPLNERHLLIDLVASLKTPALIVSRSGLGAINHSLMTIEALTRRTIAIAGVVMVGPIDEISRENRLAIEHYGRTTVVGEMPMLNPLTPASLRMWAETSLDANGRLTECLT
jgi:dethiobiotin synthase